MTSVYRWNRRLNVLRQPTLAELLNGKEEVLECADILWIDLSGESEEDEKLVLQRFWPVHALTFEDITRLRREPDSPPHFPKVEEFTDYLFVIVNPLTGETLKHIAGEAKAKGDAKTKSDSQDEAPTFTQLSAVVTHNILITHHAAPLGSIDRVRSFLQRHTQQLERGPDYILHLILDDMVDQYAPLLDHIEGTLDDLETKVYKRPRPIHFNHLLQLKRHIIHLRKTLIYEREVLVRLARGEFELVDERETVYYRNVYDHLVRFGELIESSREMVSDLMQSYLAATSNHLNQIMKVLTMISTIVLPMTLIAGIYGMNFKNLPELEWALGYPWALGLMGVSGLASLGFFYWKRWL